MDLFGHFVDLTRAHARESVAAYRAQRMPVTEFVLVLTVNRCSSVVGLYPTLSNLTDDVRLLIGSESEDWLLVDDGKWLARDGRMLQAQRRQR